MLTHYRYWPFSFFFFSPEPFLLSKKKKKKKRLGFAGHFPPSARVDYPCLHPHVDSSHWSRQERSLATMYM